MSFDSSLSGLLFTIPEAYHHRLASLRIKISKKQVKPHTLLPASHCCHRPTVVCSFIQSMSAGLRSNEEYVLLQVLRRYKCRSLQETRQAFIAPSTPILSSPSTPSRRPQRTILPWECPECRRVSRRLLRQNVNWQSGVRKLGRCALGVYMCHTNGVSANLIILTQEDIRRTRTVLQNISGVPTGACSCVLSYPTQPDEEIALWTGSKVCLHLRGFISLISLEGWGFRLIFRSFSIVLACSSCRQNSSPANKR